MLIRSLRLGLGAFILLGINLAHAATVKTVRVWHDTDHTRIVLDLDAPVQHTLVLASNPTRIILDVPNTSLKATVAHLPLSNTPIEIVRNSVVNKNDLRLVFDLKKRVLPKSFLLKKRDGNNDRLVVDLYDSNDADTPAAKSSVATVTTKSLASSSDKKIVTATSEASNIEDLVGDEKANSTTSKAAATTTVNRPILIAIDAGHGGEDTGALGPNNMREKDVTLAIAKELASVINAQPGFSARMTRSGDYFVILQKRRDLARDMKADLFISIHADSFTDSTAFGASVFALSRKGATSEMARFLAQRENDSDLVGRVGGVSLEDKDAVLAGVLVDLSMTATVNSSLQLGSSVLNSIAGISPLHAKHVEQAGFVVLKSPDVPSILVETGFISNKKESQKLASPAYRAQMAQAIFSGVKQYLALHPVNTAQVPSSSEEKPKRK